MRVIRVFFFLVRIGRHPMNHISQGGGPLNPNRFRGETLADFSVDPLWVLGPLMGPALAKIAGEKCWPKMPANMSPPQSPAQRVPIGRCARSWRVCRCRFLRPSLQRNVSRLAVALGAGGSVFCLPPQGGFPVTMSAGGACMRPLLREGDRGSQSQEEERASA